MKEKKVYGKRCVFLEKRLAVIAKLRCVNDRQSIGGTFQQCKGSRKRLQRKGHFCWKYVGVLYV